MYVEAGVDGAGVLEEERLSEGRVCFGVSFSLAME